MSHRRGLSLVIGVALLLGACTDDGTPAPAPSPPTTDGTTDDTSSDRDEPPQLAVVYPAPGEVERSVETYDELVQRVRASVGSALRDVREVTLDGAGFRRDVLLLLADEGVALACALGAGARDVAALARELPEQRFCSVDDRIEEVPPNVVATWFRYEEAAYLLGFAAARVLPASPTPPTLGFLTPSFDTRSERQRLAFTAGARAARPDVEVAVATLTDDEGAPIEQRTAVAAVQLFDELGAGTVFLTPGVPLTPVLTAARNAGALVTGIDQSLSRSTPAGFESSVLASAHARLEVGLEIPVRELLDGWQGGVRSLGFADDALVLTPGGSPAWDTVRQEIGELQTRVAAGEVAVF